MRMSKPMITASPTPGWFRIGVSIQLENFASQYPDTLWYEFPEAYQDWLYMGMEPYVLAMHQFAMACGEDIAIDGPLSERLVYNLREYQTIFRTWYPEFFKPIQIQHAGMHSQLPQSAGRAATSFSGGVDSFFTLFQQHRDREPLPGYQVSDGFKIFFNMARYDRTAFDHRVATLTPALADLDFNLIPANTNTRRFLAGDTVSDKFFFLNKTFVCELTSVGMLLSGEIGRYLIASGHHFSESGPSGSDLITDPMLTSEWYETIHYGGTSTRWEKIEAIADEPIVQNFVSVCLDKPDQNISCGVGSKCLRTITSLDLLGKLDGFTVFESLERPKLARTLGRLSETRFMKENLELARRMNHSEYVRVMKTAQIVYKLRLLRRSVRSLFSS